MKPLLANRTIQWAIALLVGFGLTLAAHSALISDRGAPASSTAVEPLGPSAVPTAPPPTPKQAPAPLSDRRTEYHMAVDLIADDHLLQGASSVTWRNPGTKPVNEMYFHLYPNAFESKKTTFNRESGGKLREDEMTKDSVGRMDIGYIKSATGEDLTPRMTFVQPDDQNTNDRTLMKLELPEPILPGQSITLSVGFTVQLPRVFARMGYADDFTMAGQWFPKVAAYETAGTRGRAEEGWDLHQYHGNSEFYSDFGIYDVKIKVPSAYTVAATGFPTKQPVTEGAFKTYHFYADDVHDFAWAASPHFIYAEEKFSAPNVPGVKIKLYLDPKQQDLKSRYFLAAKKALTRYSEWYGAYPYSTLSIVVPPGDANGAGGMEYPTLVTAWGASDPNPGYDLERVVVHEIGHQYWYGMVATNEFEEAWLDEGFTSYAEDKLMEREYGVKPNLPLEASYMTSPAPLKLNSWDYEDHNEYGDNVYTRAKLVLMAMEKEVGSDTMGKIMKTYFQTWKFKHPTTKDFQTTVETVTGKSWADFFDRFIYDKQMIDYSVDSIQVKRIGSDASPQYESHVILRQRGAKYGVVPVQFHFADGSKAEKTWDVSQPAADFTVTNSSPVDWVLVDPEHTLVLENKHMNNFLKAAVDVKWQTRINIGVIKIIETLFGWVAW